MLTQVKGMQMAFILELPLLLPLSKRKPLSLSPEVSSPFHVAYCQLPLALPLNTQGDNDSKSVSKMATC